MNINLIVCTDKQFGIGKENTIPWHYSRDLQYFKGYTINTKSNKKNVVIMGNNTYKSLPNGHRPLKDRLNIVLTRDTELTKNNNSNVLSAELFLSTSVLYFNSTIDILKFLEKNKKNINEAWVIGGSKVYTEFLDLQIVKNIYLTFISGHDFNCDVFFPNKYLKSFNLKDRLIEEDYNTNSYSIQKDELQFFLYEYMNKEELKYLNTIDKILNKGVEKLDRTKIGTVSVFGKSFKYNIRNYRLPLFTHRKMFARGIIEELLFFISGKTDTKLLESKNVNIWKGNTSREFLDSRNLNHLKEGDMGAGYSFQLRHFGADYVDAETDYINKGFDQLKYVIDLIKRDPNSRRILFSYWNPSDLKKVALPSCFLKDTQVLTNEGYVGIQNLTLNDIVYTHKGEWHKIKSLYSRKYEGLIYYISCQHNTKYIKTTEEHPFYVTDGIKEKPYWCKANELQEKHLLCMPINKNKNVKILTSTKLEKNEITYEDCYMFGYYLNTGYSNTHNTKYYISIYDHDLLNVSTNFENLSLISEHNSVDNKEYSKYEIINYKYKTYLKELGSKRYNKRIPEWIIDLPQKYLTYFLKGYNNNNLDDFVIQSKQVAYNLQRIFAKLQLYTSIIYRPNEKNKYKLSIVKNGSLIDNNYQYFKIQSILTKTQSVNVYNIEVEKDNSYIVQNITVHNCHILYQFYVDSSKNELSCSFYQRSSDFVLAANFNIVSAAVLTFMLCHITGYKPGKVIHNIGDVHIYKNHIEETKKMLNNNPHNFPILNINDPENKIKEITDFTYENFKILLYKSYDKYNFKMAV
jgi:dihydrofolate reductase/thymidylate synthase